ncbi:MAG: ATP-binding protein [Candidatus Aenigmarchaeota archaeon]|nr:ATP-binding protein [Candidatus Aenigmarchaeota archaeon]
MKIEDIEVFNPWWKAGRVKEEWLKGYKRKLYFEIEQHAGKRQAVLIWGLRRVGKTTMMFQLIERLLESESPRNILYFSFDEMAFDLKDVLDSYQKLILGKTFGETKDRLYIFLDEVQKVKDWENKIKVFYDLYPNIKFFLSGSASVAFRKRAKESLAGRILDFLLKPLDFQEFLEITGKDAKKIKENPSLWKRELLPLFYRYLRHGTFPELVNEDDDDFVRKYLLNNVIDRIIYKDIPEEFGSIDIELLKNLVYMVGNNPGMIVNYREISRNLGKDHRTIANYFEYLEFSLLIRFVFNYRGSPLASMRKLKKAYLATPNLIYAFIQDMEKALPSMLENAILNALDTKFFYRNGFEVDFIIPDKDTVDAIEIKKGGKEIKQIRKFIKKFGKKVRTALVVDMEDERVIDNIEITPAWKFLLFKS